MMPRCSRSSSSVSASARAGVNDDGKRNVARDLEMPREAFALAAAHVVGVHLEVVEPSFADANDPLMARAIANPIERAGVTRAFGV
jgi:hypothetical protein